MNSVFSYIIANQSIKIVSDSRVDLEKLLPGFLHFKECREKKEPLIEITMGFEPEGLELVSADSESVTIHTFEIEEGLCKLSRAGNRYLFSITKIGGDVSIVLAMDIGSPKVSCRCVCVNGGVYTPNPFHLKFSLWMAFGFKAIPQKISALHSSVIVYNNSAVLFLGESGTGKSTHTKIWLQHISGSKLLNDDSPILSVEGSEVVVYGSPWSGKGQKYINERYPVKGFVRIKQHSSNKLERLNTLESFGALYPSFPPAFLKDNLFKGYICEIISNVISTIPVYHLYCLPNGEAALLVKENLYR